MAQINKPHFNYYINFIFLCGCIWFNGSMNMNSKFVRIKEKKKCEFILCFGMTLFLKNDVNVLEEVKPKCLGFSKFQWKI